MDVPIVSKRCFEVVKLVMGLHRESLKVVVFMMELHHMNLKGYEANMEASSYGLLYRCKLVSGPFHNNN